MSFDPKDGRNLVIALGFGGGVFLHHPAGRSHQRGPHISAIVSWPQCIRPSDVRRSGDESRAQHPRVLRVRSVWKMVGSIRAGFRSARLMHPTDERDDHADDGSRQHNPSENNTSGQSDALSLPFLFIQPAIYFSTP